jgi:hypothetical protein
MGEILDLYSKGVGLKRLAKLTGVSASTAKRYLLHAGVYRGKERPVLEPELTADPNDPNTWDRRYDAECVPADGGGWLLRLPSPTSELLCTLSPQRWASRSIHVSLRGNPTSGHLAGLYIGIGNDSGAQEKRIHAVQCGFQYQFMPSPWHLTAQCGDEPFLFLQGTSYAVQNIHLIEINVQEVYTHGHK